MPLAKKLTCGEAAVAVKAFLDGAAVKDIAEHFEVTRLTISRMLRRESYKECKEVNELVDDDYINQIEARMKENSKRGRGRKEEVDFAKYFA